jgi:hypothetical protein
MIEKIPDRYFPFLLILLFIVFVIIGLSTSDFIFQVGLFVIFGFIVQWLMKKRNVEKNTQIDVE